MMGDGELIDGLDATYDSLLAYTEQHELGLKVC